MPLTLIDGSESNLGAVAGGAVLVVNVASECGFTRQYAGLEALYEQFHDLGLEIVGVPCNQFGGQESGTAEEIVEFCTKNFGVTFPLAAKTDVNGPDAHPLFVQLTADGTDPVKWNFEKFLIGQDGTLLGRYDSRVEPDSDELLAAIKSALGTK